MEISSLILLGSLFSAAVSFLYGLCYNIKGDVRGAKFMAYSLLTLAISCAILLYCGGGQMSLGQARNLAIAALGFISLSALFYWAYQLTKNNNDEKRA